MSEEVVSFELGAAERVLKGITAVVVVLAEVNLISDHVAIVAAALRVALVEPALLVLNTLAVHFLAIVQHEGR